MTPGLFAILSTDLYSYPIRIIIEVIVTSIRKFSDIMRIVVYPEFKRMAVIPGPFEKFHGLLLCLFMSVDELVTSW